MGIKNLSWHPGQLSISKSLADRASIHLWDVPRGIVGEYGSKVSQYISCFTELFSDTSDMSITLCQSFMVLTCLGNDWIVFLEVSFSLFENAALSNLIAVVSFVFSGCFLSQQVLEKFSFLLIFFNCFVGESDFWSLLDAVLFLLCLSFLDLHVFHFSFLKFERFWILVSSVSTLM